jgi:hypothetical protein
VSKPSPTRFFILIFRDDQPGPQYRIFTTAEGLARFAVECEEEKHKSCPASWGPYEVFAADVQALAVVKIGVEAMRKLTMGKVVR